MYIFCFLASIPRYARVNLLLTTVDDVIKVLNNEGYAIKTSSEKQEKVIETTQGSK